MRSLVSGGELLRANMVLLVWVGSLLKRGELMGKVCGDSFTKGGEDCLIISPFKFVMVLLFISGMIVGIRRAL